MIVPDTAKNQTTNQNSSTALTTQATKAPQASNSSLQDTTANPPATNYSLQDSNHSAQETNSSLQPLSPQIPSSEVGGDKATPGALQFRSIPLRGIATGEGVSFTPAPNPFVPAPDDPFAEIDQLLTHHFPNQLEDEEAWECFARELQLQPKQKLLLAYSERNSFTLRATLDRELGLSAVKIFKKTGFQPIPGRDQKLYLEDLRKLAKRENMFFLPSQSVKDRKAESKPKDPPPYLYCEIDDQSIGEQIDVWEQFEAATSLRVLLLYTGNKSLHAYVLLESRPESWGEWIELQNILASYVGADVTNGVPTQPMRAPGFPRIVRGVEREVSLLYVGECDRVSPAEAKERILAAWPHPKPYTAERYRLYNLVWRSLRKAEIQARVDLSDPDSQPLAVFRRDIKDSQEFYNSLKLNREHSSTPDKERAARQYLAENSPDFRQLPLEHIVYTATGESLTLNDALVRSAKNGGTLKLRDPIEPGYPKGRGAQVAVLYWNGGYNPILYSQAHGGATYGISPPYGLQTYIAFHGIYKALNIIPTDEAEATLLKIRFLTIPPALKSTKEKAYSREQIKERSQLRVELKIKRGQLNALAKVHLNKAYTANHFVSQCDAVGYCVAQGWMHGWDTRELMINGSSVSLGKTANITSKLVAEAQYQGIAPLIMTSLRALNETSANQYRKITKKEMDDGQRPSEYQKHILKLMKQGVIQHWPDVVIVTQETDWGMIDEAIAYCCPVIFCPESLHKVMSVLAEYQGERARRYVLCMDEADASASRLINGALGGSPTTNTENLKKLFSEATKIFLAQDCISNSLIKRVQEHGGIGKAHTNIRANRLPPNPNIDCYFYQDGTVTGLDEQMYALYQLVKRGDSVACLTASRAEGRKVIKRLARWFARDYEKTGKPHDFSVFDSHGDRAYNLSLFNEFKADPDGYYKAFEKRLAQIVTIISPSMSHGFSVNTVQFDHLFYFPAGWTGGSDVVQQLARVRDFFGDRGMRASSVHLRFARCETYFPPDISEETIRKQIEDEIAGLNRSKLWEPYVDLAELDEKYQAEIEQTIEWRTSVRQLEILNKWLEIEYVKERISSEFGWSVQPELPEELQYRKQLEAENAEVVDFVSGLIWGAEDYIDEESAMIAKCEMVYLENGQEPSDIKEILGAQKYYFWEQVGDATSEYGGEEIRLIDAPDFYKSYKLGPNARKNLRAAKGEAQFEVFLKHRKELNYLAAYDRGRAQRNYTQKISACPGDYLGFGMSYAQFERFSFLANCEPFMDLLEDGSIQSGDYRLEDIKKLCFENKYTVARLLGVTASATYDPMSLFRNLLKWVGCTTECTDRSGKGKRTRTYGIVRYIDKRSNLLGRIEGASGKIKEDGGDLLPSGQVSLIQLESRAEYLRLLIKQWESVTAAIRAHTLAGMEAARARIDKAELALYDTYAKEFVEGVPKRLIPS